MKKRCEPEQPGIQRKGFDLLQDVWVNEELDDLCPR